MRIIGEIAHPRMKITIFKMNDKVSVKFEAALVEHIVKFRDGSGIESLEQVQAFFNESWIDQIEEGLLHSAKLRSEQFNTLLTESEQIFPDII